MEFNWSIHTKDKIRNLNNLIHKIEFELLNKGDNLGIEDLRRQCFLIEEHILDGIYFVKTKEIKEKSIRVLIWNIKKGVEIQKKLEKMLVDRGSNRNYENEEEIFAAFDFNLDNEEDLSFLPNAEKLEERIKRETGFSNEKVNRSVRKKVGRKKAEVREAKEYLKKFVNEIHKEKFISELKNLYQSSDHFTFNLLIKVMIDLGYLEPITRVALKKSFEKALDREKQSQQNFNKQFNQNLKDTIEYKNLYSKISGVFESSLTK